MDDNYRIELTHKTEKLHFYTYKRWPDQVYVSEVNYKGSSEINAGEFGFIQTTKKLFKMTEDVYLDWEHIKDIYEFMQNFNKV